MQYVMFEFVISTLPTFEDPLNLFLNHMFPTYQQSVVIWTVCYLVMQLI